MGFKGAPSPSTFCSSATPSSFPGCRPVVPGPPQPLLESSASADGRGLPLGPESPPVRFQWVLEGSRLRGRNSRRAATARPSPRTWAERPPSCRPRGGAEIVPSPPPPLLKRVNFFKPHLLSYCLFSGSSSNFRYPPQMWLGSPVIPERSAIHLKSHHSSRKQANTVSPAAAFVWATDRLVVSFLSRECTARPSPHAGGPHPRLPRAPPNTLSLRGSSGAGPQPGPSHAGS